MVIWKLKKREGIKDVSQASGLSKWVETFTEMEKTRRRKGFRWTREVDIKSSVWSTLIKVFVKHPNGLSNEQ